jgi:hypothetical protein
LKGTLVSVASAESKEVFMRKIGGSISHVTRPLEQAKGVLMDHKSQQLRGSTLQQHNNSITMRLLRSLLPSILLVSVGVVEAASSWKFQEASVSISGKGGVGSGSKDK